MKPNKSLLLLLSLVLLSACTSCSSSKNPNPKEVINQELGHLQDMDSKTVDKYISYQDVFPQANSSGKVPTEVDEVISLFFQDFAYDIMNIDTDKDTAEASVKLTTIDAATLAKDFAKAELKDLIQSQLDNEQISEISLSRHYELLLEVLKNGKYETKTTPCTIHLIRQNEKWAIVRDEELENQLVGGFITYMADPNVLLPSETVITYFDTLKSMDAASMGKYIGLTDLLSSGNSTSDITNALMEQVHNHFSYEVKDEQNNGYSATVNCTITSFDSASIISDYTKQMDAYNQTVDAVIDGQEGRQEKSDEVLLDCINKGDGTITTDVVLNLTNDSHHWYMVLDEEFGKALFGDFGQVDSTADENTDSESSYEEDSDDTSDESYEESYEDYDDSSDYEDSYEDGE